MEEMHKVDQKKPHVVFIPLPAQSHIKCMLKLARLLHHKGLRVTFINTQSNHKRLVKSGGTCWLDDSPGFQFLTVPDGLPSTPDSDDEPIQTIEQVSQYMAINFLDSFLDLVARLDTPVTCIVSDGFMTFANSNISGYSLWKEEPECFQWLQSKEPNSVVYVNFGCLAVMSLQDLVEFGWGLVNSNHYFLWIIRADLIDGKPAVLPPELEEVIKRRGFIARWCSQEEVLNHPSVGGFLTHGGWGSVIESLSAGVPMICCPFSGDQRTNCAQMCKEWEVGMEIGRNVKRDEVEKRVRELMEGVEGARV
ncbi:hypothetical protein L1987_48191 [Smallanthus sonchifolius]|uniref:Uncharacterized protein n=1 Tax=Smallanthus sonchifolius TaxID=185202 RepID=A0ACB9FRS6_9ASTR|nr:hypothetical protein L1987_48191 [Smallanthus sonchifolius]